MQSLVTPVALTSYLVSVDCSLSLTDMVRAGKYANDKDAIDAITEERFPVDRTRALQYDKELFPVPPSRDGITTAEWQAELEADDWVLEKVSELLTLGAKHSNLQLNNYIVAFGSSWRDPLGRLHSPVLWFDDGERGADTHWYYPNDLWSSHDRALVSRKRR